MITNALSPFNSHAGAGLDEDYPYVESTEQRAARRAMQAHVAAAALAYLVRAGAADCATALGLAAAEQMTAAA